MESLSLRIQILHYLLNNDAVDKKIDVGFPFLDADDSIEVRESLRGALDYLQNEKFILLNGSPIHLLSKQAGVHPSKYHTGLTASITKLGENELRPTKDTSTTHHIHMENVINPIVNSSISQSDFNKNENSLNNETTTNSIDKKSQTKSKIEVLYWLIGILVGLIGIYEYLHNIHFKIYF